MRIFLCSTRLAIAFAVAGVAALIGPPPAVAQVDLDTLPPFEQMPELFDPDGERSLLPFGNDGFSDQLPGETFDIPGALPPDGDDLLETDEGELPAAPFLYGEALRQKELADLFDTLAKAPNPIIAQRIASAIQEKWNTSGSATVDLLMQRARRAMGRERMDVAYDLASEAISLAPSHAEAWNLRATLSFLRGDLQKSMADVQHVLSLEPNHFGALTGMGAILSRSGRDEAALAVYRRALEVYPQLPSAKAASERLQKTLDNATL